MPGTRPDLAAGAVNYQRPPALADALENDMAVRPRPRQRRGAAIWCLAVLGLGLSALSGCASKSAARAPGAEAPAYDGGSSIDDLERALADEERRLAAVGVRLPEARADLSVADAADAGDAGEAYAESEDAAPSEPPPAAPEAAPMSAGADRSDVAEERRQCSDVCRLSASICDLEGHICGLAQRHPGEDRYAQVCERASGDCRAAQEACDGCR